MLIYLNGQQREVADAATVYDVLCQMQLDKLMVAIELNGHLVTSDRHNSTTIHPGDRLMLISPVGGG